jgi:uncharacterized membrane protein YeiH
VQTQILTQFFELVSLVGLIVFAASGALRAAEKRLDILGFILIGTLTAIGGGSLRDLLLGNTPVFWVADSSVVFYCVITCIAAYFIVPHLQRRESWLLWLDAAGLAVFAVMGAQLALLQGVAPLIAVVMGVMSATFGGIMRDVLCADSLMLMRPELYISCALAGALSFVLLRQLPLTLEYAELLAFAIGFCLRGGAIIFGWKLPQYGGSGERR